MQTNNNIGSASALLGKPWQPSRGPARLQSWWSETWHRMDRLRLFPSIRHPLTTAGNEAANEAFNCNTVPFWQLVHTKSTGWLRLKCLNSDCFAESRALICSRQWLKKKKTSPKQITPQWDNPVHQWPDEMKPCVSRSSCMLKPNCLFSWSISVTKNSQHGFIIFTLQLSWKMYSIYAFVASRRMVGWVLNIEAS